MPARKSAFKQKRVDVFPFWRHTKKLQIIQGRCFYYSWQDDTSKECSSERIYTLPFWSCFYLFVRITILCTYYFIKSPFSQNTLCILLICIMHIKSTDRPKKNVWRCIMLRIRNYIVRYEWNELERREPKCPTMTCTLIYNAVCSYLFVM